MYRFLFFLILPLALRAAPHELYYQGFEITDPVNYTTVGTGGLGGYWGTATSLDLSFTGETGLQFFGGANLASEPGINQLRTNTISTVGYASAFIEVDLGAVSGYWENTQVDHLSVLLYDTDTATTHSLAEFLPNASSGADLVWDGKHLSTSLRTIQIQIPTMYTSFQVWVDADSTTFSEKVAIDELKVLAVGVPEPSTYLLLGSALGVVLYIRRKRASTTGTLHP